MNDQTVDRAADAHRAMIEHRAEPPKPPKAQLMVGATPKALVPVDFEGAWRIANTVHLAGMAPRSLNSAEKCMVAILHGLEVGLTPMNALQSIAVINGKPTIYGDGAIGLIRASGLLEYMHEYYENEDKPNMKAICVVKRKGEPKPIQTDFSMGDAKTAGLLGKEGPWQTYPKRMLKMRARWALRDTFADVLKGLGLAEEAEDLVRQQEAATQERRKVPSPPADEVAETAAEQEQPAEPAKTDQISTGVAEVSDFPGDKPVKSKDDGLDLPASLRRVPSPPKKAALSDDERDWIIGLEGAFSGDEDMDSIDDHYVRLLEPFANKFSSAAVDAAMAVYNENCDRIGAI